MVTRNPQSAIRNPQWLALLCLMACACSSVQKPQVTFKSMNVGSVDANGFTMNFDMDVANPNPVALPLADADYSLKLAGAKVLDGKAKPAGTLPANGSIPVTLPVALTWDNLLACGEALRSSGGTIPYGFDGGLSFSPAGMPVRVPLTYSGTLDLKSLLKDPMVLLKSPAARAIAQKIAGSIMNRP